MGNMTKPVAARIEEFVEYHITGDGECNNTVLKEWAKRRNLNLQERYELSYFFAVTYCVESAIAMFMERKSISEDASGWARENKKRLIFQSDRKYMRMRDCFEKAMAYFQENLYDVRTFLQKVTKDGKIVLRDAIQYVSKWYMFGRFSSFLLLETFAELTAIPCENTTIEWEKGDTATSGLLNVYGYDDAANEFDKRGVLRQKTSEMDNMLEHLKMRIEKRGGNSNVTEIETSLCAYRKFYKATRYNGYYLDRMLEEIYAMSKDFPAISEELMEIRKGTCSKKYLGEIGGWNGIRRELKSAYLMTGEIT